MKEELELKQLKLICWIPQCPLNNEVTFYSGYPVLMMES